ncbi:DUF982 domain-containing protein [Rhizobium sp. LjRoot98]|uniref:DUF982 domain-containing protein n=1 Tax=Rhizobium sp. LjRoot98 TaxID=3342345 RepID=UPI000AC75121
MTVSWSEPVEFVVPGSGDVKVRGPQDALDYLVILCPSDDGGAYHTCKTACSEAIDVVVSTETARQAFVVIVRDAGMGPKTSPSSF